MPADHVGDEVQFIPENVAIQIFNAFSNPLTTKDQFDALIHPYSPAQLSCCHYIVNTDAMDADGNGKELTLLQHASRVGIYSADNPKGVSLEALKVWLAKLGQLAADEIDRLNLINVTSDVKLQQMFINHTWSTDYKRLPTLSSGSSPCLWTAYRAGAVTGGTVLGGLGATLAVLAIFQGVSVSHDAMHTAMKTLCHLVCGDTEHLFGIEGAPTWPGHKGLVLFCAAAAASVGAGVVGALVQNRVVSARATKS